MADFFFIVIAFIGSLLLGAVVALFTGFLVFILLSLTSVAALHLGYIDCVLVTAAVGIATSRVRSVD